jgi:hypothetical protein
MHGKSRASRIRENKKGANVIPLSLRLSFRVHFHFVLLLSRLLDRDDGWMDGWADGLVAIRHMMFEGEERVHCARFPLRHFCLSLSLWRFFSFVSIRDGLTCRRATNIRT